MESFHISPAVLLDPENVGVAFGVVLLSCIEVEIMRYFNSHLLPVNGGHLCFTAHADIAQYENESRCAEA